MSLEGGKSRIRYQLASAEREREVTVIQDVHGTRQNTSDITAATVQSDVMTVVGMTTVDLIEGTQTIEVKAEAKRRATETKVTRKRTTRKGK
jgi:hypothetical protein